MANMETDSSMLDEAPDSAEAEMEESAIVGGEKESETDEEPLTAQSALATIESAWLNEKFAPEILPHESDLVDCMLQQITHMEENMKKLKKDDLRLGLHKMEIDRIRYVIASYLRTRIEKIEHYAIQILTEESQRHPEEKYLTTEELKFAKDYLASMETLFRTVALRHMPTNFQEFQIDRMAVRPNLQSHVFLRANKAIEGIIVPGTMDQEVSFEAGSQHIIQYRAIADLVKNRSVQLI